MRLMANLIVSFRKETDDENASGIDMLNFTKFDVLEVIIKQLTKKEDGHERAGLKMRFGFLLQKAVKAMKGYFIMKGEFDQEADMTRFSDVFDVNWNFIFTLLKLSVNKREEVFGSHLLCQLKMTFQLSGIIFWKKWRNK
ncbi:hypothetical protein PoB_000779600 [Plakobranchus ocellatus]|uniref:Uncharacterized protein n=1 Tax=Plakobranchus ocellatus TaxID=259542 RepID=A0AAV3Y243_9GAST|nr:hypothetical protein PoB_000779600 [Plakobranchus ocellatus]